MKPTCLLLFLTIQLARAQTFEPIGAPIYLDASRIESLHGLSGIEYIPQRDEWVLVSDRHRVFEYRGVRNFAEFGDPARLKIPPRRSSGWFEAVRYDAAHDVYFFATESDHVTAVRYSYRRVNPDSAHTLLRIPLPFDNKGVEGLALTPTGYLWVAPEAGWEGEVSLNGCPAVHFFRYQTPLATDPSSDDDPLPERFSYPIDRFPGAAFESDRYGGISEILAVDDTHLLVLERAFFRNPDRVSARIYRATIQEATQSFTKEIAFDFDAAYARNVPPANVEGLAWGPLQPDGKRTLLVLADDNFKNSTTLRNQLIVLKELVKTN